MSTKMPAHMDATREVYFVLCKKCAKARELRLEEEEKIQVKDDAKQAVVFVCTCAYCGYESLYRGSDLLKTEDFLAKNLRMSQAEALELRKRLMMTETALKIAEKVLTSKQNREIRHRAKIRELSDECRRLADMVHEKCITNNQNEPNTDEGIDEATATVNRVPSIPKHPDWVPYK